MKPTEITYERLINTGNFSHEKYSITIALDENDSPTDAYQKARNAIEKQINRPSASEFAVAKIVAEYEKEDIPF